ncbi:hypothetical protein D9M68_159280 [compost metagenome]
MGQAVAADATDIDIQRGQFAALIVDAASVAQVFAQALAENVAGLRDIACAQAAEQQGQLIATDAPHLRWQVAADIQRVGAHDLLDALSALFGQAADHRRILARSGIGGAALIAGVEQLAEYVGVGAGHLVGTAELFGHPLHVGDHLPVQGLHVIKAVIIAGHADAAGQLFIELGEVGQVTAVLHPHAAAQFGLGDEMLGINANVLQQFGQVEHSGLVELLQLGRRDLDPLVRLTGEQGAGDLLEAGRVMVARRRLQRLGHQFALQLAGAFTAPRLGHVLGETLGGEGAGLRGGHQRADDAL